jgi:hypothetical protein
LLAENDLGGGGATDISKTDEQDTMLRSGGILHGVEAPLKSSEKASHDNHK